MSTKGVPHRRYKKVGKSYEDYLREAEEKESKKKPLTNQQ